MQTKIETKLVNGLIVVSLSGRLDAHGSELIKDEMHKLSDEKKRQLLLNLGEVNFIDSSGLGLIVSSFRRVREKDGEMSICCMTPQVQTIFELTRLHRIFNIFDSEAEAISSIV